MKSHIIAGWFILFELSYWFFGIEIFKYIKDIMVYGTSTIDFYTLVLSPIGLIFGW